MKKLYLFDFDGTLTTKDTMFLFLRFYNPWKFYLNFMKFSPLFFLVKCKLLQPESVKQNFISALLKGETSQNLQKLSEEFTERYWGKIMRKNALDFIENSKRSPTEGCLVTASLDMWAAPFAQKLGLNLISTEAEFIGGKFTGKFATPNCNGPEKVVRVKKFLAGKKFDKIIAFGDTSGDREMLDFADESFFKYFH